MGSARPPGWARALLRRAAPADRCDDVLGDLEEAHGRRVARRGRVVGTLLTSVETIDLAVAMLLGRLRPRGATSPRGPTAVAGSRRAGPGFSWLDFKLGFRMLRKHPGLTAVAGISIAFAIALGAGTFEFLTDMIYPRLPLDEGDRIVEIRNIDVAEGHVASRAYHDYVTWRDELDSVDEIGAYQWFRRTLRTERGLARTLSGAAMTASAFEIARVPPLMGRPIVASDETPGAPDVVVIGYDVWRSIFDGDPGVVGATARLGSEPVTVVGVMPDGFGWPWAQSLWTPLRVDELGFGWGEGPGVSVVARLADGVDRDAAQAELNTIGGRLSAEHPASHEHVRPEVARYGQPHVDEGTLFLAGMYTAQGVFFALLVLLVCGNVGLLLFARTAAREREIVVRSALGAGRSRIVGQLFAEALVLGGCAAALGLGGAHAGLAWVLGMFDRFWAGQGEILGFWTGADISGMTVTYAVVWTLVAAVVAGVLPALRVTGRGVQPRLQGSASGGSGLEFGRLWTTVIVTQVAVTVAFVPVVILLGSWTRRIHSADYGFPAAEYLSLELAEDRVLAMNPANGDDLQRTSDAWYRSAVTELRRRVSDDLDLPGVTLVGEVPGAFHPRRRIELEGQEAPGPTTLVAHVDADFFRAVGARFVEGRAFTPAEVDAPEHVAVVNEDFVRKALGGRSPVGRRLAFLQRGDAGDRPREWYRIVGVVRQVAVRIDPEDSDDAGVYLPLDPDAYPVRMAIHVGADPLSLVPRLQRLAGEIDPELQLTEIRPLDESAYQLDMAYTSWFWVTMGAGAIGLLLSNAGIFSIMSFTVSRRTREIGVRVALGADRGRIVWAVFSRSLKQIGLGVVLGGVILAVMAAASTDFTRLPSAGESLVLVAYLVVMVCVCAVACLVPTRRALGIEPTEALRADG